MGCKSEGLATCQVIFHRAFLCKSVDFCGLAMVHLGSGVLLPQMSSTGFILITDSSLYGFVSGGDDSSISCVANVRFPGIRRASLVV